MAQYGTPHKYLAYLCALLCIYLDLMFHLAWGGTVYPSLPVIGLNMPLKLHPKNAVRYGMV